MTVHEHMKTFAGKPVVQKLEGVEPEEVVYRITGGSRWNRKSEAWISKLRNFLGEDPLAPRLFGILLGTPYGTENCQEEVDALVAASKRLANLKAIFLGDLTWQEYEMSWLFQADVTGLLYAYPHLEHLGTRGIKGYNDEHGLKIGPIHHARLKTLVVQSGGLPVEIVQQITASQFPALEHLELWLGSENYRATYAIEDLLPLFSPSLFPRLRYFGLRNSERCDQIAREIAGAPILEQLEVLDLSLGTLGDEGAEALLASPYIEKLAKLDLHFHFCREDMVAKLQQLPIEVNTEDRQEEEQDGDDVWRYIFVSE